MSWKFSLSMKRNCEAYLNQAGIAINGTQPGDIQIHNEQLYRKMLYNPSLAAGESYVAGWWDCDRLDEFFYKICRCYQHQSFYWTPSAFISLTLNKLFNFQTKWRSKEVAEKHYNLGNDLYELMLGPSMAYTCGYWETADNLNQAQYDKFDLVCRKLRLQKGDSVLELGCGWGSFAKFAAENYGCSVVGVNISSEQIKYAKESCRHLPVTFYLCDYRDDHIYNPSGRHFDKVASIGLCEHVGPKNYCAFMQVAQRNLQKEGLFLLHTIGKNDSVPYVDPWINKYIFPNGMLPSLAELCYSSEGLFIIEDVHNFGASYDKTLMAWHANFVAHWAELKERYGESFYRMWNYYLLSCAGAFRARGIQLYQLVLSPQGVPGGYHSIRGTVASSATSLQLAGKA